MKNYKYLILLKDNVEKVEHIILANCDAKEIQDAIFKAKNDFENLEEENNLPCGIYCEYEYIIYCLQEKYDIILADEHFIKNEVYY